MGYILKAFIAKPEVLSIICKEYESSTMVELSQGFSMIPMTDQFFDEINNLEISTEISTFEFLNKNIEQKILNLIGELTIAYVESEFFGGEGGHIGLIWKNRIPDPIKPFHKQSMNSILNEIGVKKTTGNDEFISLGLDLYRETHEWINHIQEQSYTQENNWKITKETKRHYIDSSYYLKAIKESEEGQLIIEITWADRFMYDLSIHLITKNTGIKGLFKKETKKWVYGLLIQKEDRVEKYGHQVIRITQKDPLAKIKRLNEFQQDSVLNWNIYNKFGIEIKSTLPIKN